MMKGSMSTDLGIITVSPDVIAKYAGSVAIECFGIVGMAAVNVKDGLVHLLKRESLTRGIKVGISDENILTLNSCDRFIRCEHSFRFGQPYEQC